MPLVPKPHPDTRTQKAIEIVWRNPTQTVPHAMIAAGFSEEESQDRSKQMWVRRRIPSKKSFKVAESRQPKTPANALPKSKSTLSPIQHHHPEERTTASVAPTPRLAIAAAGGDGSSIQFSEDLGFYMMEDPSAEDPFKWKLHDWISSNRVYIEVEFSGLSMYPMMQRKYLERSVQILHSLAEKIFNEHSSGGCNILDSGQTKTMVHPDFITVDNVIVHDPTALLDLHDSGQISAHFIRCGSDSSSSHAQVNEDEVKNYAAMHAFARIAYEVCMMGNGPSLPGVPSCELNMSSALSIQDERGACGIDDEEDEVLEMIRKSYRMTESKDSNFGGVTSAMVDAGIPLPIRRFIRDLLCDELGDIFRSDHAFTSFDDVLSDLKQMSDNPDVFLHGSNPDRWKLDFGDKLYGRNVEMEDLMNAANRVVTIGYDPLIARASRSKVNKTEVVMVSGNPGVGKSRLVRLGGTQLEKKGWVFLQCKFDRLVHPKPLSILSHALDEYFGFYAQFPKYGSDHLISESGVKNSHSDRAQQLHERISSLISPEDLSTLAMNIPSLQRLLDLKLPAVMPMVNETLMAALFCALLQAISSKDNPIIFFLDDLQWADELSLSLLISIVKETHLSSIHRTIPCANSQVKSSIIDTEDDMYILYVGSYREHAIVDNQVLAKALRKLQNDASINVTTISLPGMTIETLNELLSDTLHVPNRKVRPLSKIVKQKTDGLPLFVIEFIRALTVDNLLTHTFARGWEWDADSIEIFPITESVAELFASKLRRLPKDILLGLQIISCFGTQVDQHVLDLLQNYDGEKSVDIPTALNVAINEGLVKRVAHTFSFSHDLIQKATIDSILKDESVPLLRKLIFALEKKASANDSMDSILFVVVDLVNRMGSNATYCPHERALFAELNRRAGSMAVDVPDFAGAAMYAESGIALLSENCWDTQYDLSLQLHEIAVLAHFSNRTSNREQLLNRIITVFERAHNFSDKFNTHRIWTRLLSLATLPRATEECLRALNQLGEPLDLSDIDYIRVCKELVEHNERFSAKSETLLAQSLEDQNKKNAMKVMSSLILYYAQSKSFLGGFISCRMMEITMKYGYCEDSIIGAAAFAASLVSIGDIDSGSAWGHKAMALMNICGKRSIEPAISLVLFERVFVWKSPIQSTLDFLARGIRSSIVYGNVEFAVANTYVYIARSYNCGKNIGVLTEEVEALALQHGICFNNDNDASIYTPETLQSYMLSIYNILCALKEDDIPSSQGKIAKNYDLLKKVIEKEQVSCFRALLTNQRATEFMFRNMDGALKCSDLYLEYFKAKKLDLEYASIYDVFYDGLVNLYFMGQTGNALYLERGEKAISKMTEWVGYSDWNFKNKLLLMQAESYKIVHDVDRAAVCYDESIAAARDHKFIHEEAIANELAGIFFLQLGSRQRSYQYFKQSVVCYQKWGAPAIARRIESMMENELSMDILQCTTLSDTGIGVDAVWRPTWAMCRECNL